MMVDMDYVNYLRKSRRIVVTPLDKPDLTKAELIFSLASLLQMEDWVVQKALTNFYSGLFDGRIKDPEILVVDE
jgi:hypothetical protein